MFHGIVLKRLWPGWHLLSHFLDVRVCCSLFCSGPSPQHQCVGHSTTSHKWKGLCRLDISATPKVSQDRVSEFSLSLSLSLFLSLGLFVLALQMVVVVVVVVVVGSGLVVVVGATLFSLQTRIGVIAFRCLVQLLWK